MQMDKTWEAFLIPDTFEGFCEISIPSINLKTEVDKNVHDSFRVVRKLLEHSYYEYQFYDVAALKAMLTFEMAAKIRFMELNNVNCKGSLKSLIDWFHERDYFEVYNDQFLKSYRRFRNSLAHPINNDYSGIFKRQWILYTVDLINAMYENPKQTSYRKRLLVTVNKKLNEICSNGSIVTVGNQTYICYSVILVFINNKLSPEEHHFYFKPLFEIPDNFIQEKKLCDSPTQTIAGNKPRLYADRIEMKSGDKEVIIKKIENIHDRKRFDEWLNKFNLYDNIVAERSYWRTCMTELFEKHLREFHLFSKSQPL